jgi:hypothetical protein
LQLYCLATKIHGYELRITGDIDDPSWIKPNEALIDKWISLANYIGLRKPIIYVTASQNFQETKNSILNINSDVDVAIHGLKHVHHSKLNTTELSSDLEQEASLCCSHRYPYLDWNLTAIWCASEFFSTDSSLVSSWMHPFKIGKMIEYPVSPPTDTALRDNPVTNSVVQLYSDLIDCAFEADRTLTLLLHPNSWSVELLTQLSKQSN